MSYLYYILGFSITLFALCDLIWTTLWVDGGAGPLSKRVAQLTWKITEKLTYRKKDYFTIVGPVILVVTLLTWVFFMWLGITLFYSGDPQSIINTQGGGPIMWYERMYFTGYTIFTLGLGDYSPQPGFWQIITAFSSGIGIMFLTLGASYVINVVGAVGQKRSFARSITGLGMSSEDILRSAWNGEDFHQMDLVLMNAASSISLLTQQHQAYPLLHYYHSKTPEEASTVGVAILDDLLTMLCFGLEDKDSVNTILVYESRSSIETYLETLTSAFVHPSEEEPVRPDIRKLGETSIPFVEQDEFTKQLDKLTMRRKKLLGAVKSDNHDWPKHVD